MQVVRSIRRRKIRLGILLLTVFLMGYITSGCFQDRFQVEGKVLALASKSSLPGVIIRIRSVSTGDSKIFASDEEGFYRFERLSPGAYVFSSADSTKYLVSPDTFIVDSEGERKQKGHTLRAITTPPAAGVFAWVKDGWREIPAFRIEDGRLQMSREQANAAPIVPESASLLAYFPDLTWGSSKDGIDWLGVVYTDSTANFVETELRENTPEGEPVPMDPASFATWKLPGAYPVRGPTRPNLYAIVTTRDLPDGSEQRVLYPFWVPFSNHLTPLTSATTPPVNPPVTGNVQVQVGTVSNLSKLSGNMGAIDSALGGGAGDIFSKALKNFITSLQAIQSPGTTSARDSIPPVTTPAGDNRFTQEQVDRWRAQIRDAIRDRDTLRRRQTFRAIRDSAEGTSVALEADKLLLRDINGLPLH